MCIVMNMMGASHFSMAGAALITCQSADMFGSTVYVVDDDGIIQGVIFNVTVDIVCYCCK